LKITKFDWDDRNIDHIARHNITPDEAVEAFLEALFRKVKAVKDVYWYME